MDDAARSDTGVVHHSAHHAVSPRAAVEAEREARHDEDERFCVAARAASEALYAQRREKKAASDAAWNAGDKDTSKKLSHEMHELGAQAEAAAAKAAEDIFKMKNARMGPFEIDLHGLRVAEAEAFVVRRLDSDVGARGSSNDPTPGVVIIYGAGHHSADGHQHIKPAVVALLTRRQQSAGGVGEVRVDYDALTGRDNPGCVSVAYAPGGSLEALLNAQRGEAVPTTPNDAAAVGALAEHEHSPVVAAPHVAAHRHEHARTPLPEAAAAHSSSAAAAAPVEAAEVRVAVVVVGAGVDMVGGSAPQAGDAVLPVAAQPASEAGPGSGPISPASPVASGGDEDEVRSVMSLRDFLAHVPPPTSPPAPDAQLPPPAAALQEQQQPQQHTKVRADSTPAAAPDAKAAASCGDGCCCVM